MKAILCYILGHNYELEKEFSPTVRKIKCIRCKKMFGMNDDVQAIIEWDDDLERTTKICHPEKFGINENSQEYRDLLKSNP